MLRKQQPIISEVIMTDIVFNVNYDKYLFCLSIFFLPETILQIQACIFLSLGVLVLIRYKV